MLNALYNYVFHTKSITFQVGIRKTLLNLESFIENATYILKSRHLASQFMYTSQAAGPIRRDT